MRSTNVSFTITTCGYIVDEEGGHCPTKRAGAVQGGLVASQNDKTLSIQVL